MKQEHTFQVTTEQQRLEPERMACQRGAEVGDRLRAAVLARHEVEVEVV